MASGAEALTIYVPALVLRDVMAGSAPPRAPYAYPLAAVVMFADITGFTALAERLAQRGPAGAEQLSHLLNAFFGDLIAHIDHHGGQVVRFAGDALLAIWPVAGPTDHDGRRYGQAPGAACLARATVQAAASGLELQRRLRASAADGARLALRIGIGSGDLLAAHVGGVGGRWEFLLAGDPLAQVGAAEGLAEPGDVVVSPQARAQAPRHLAGTDLAGDFLRLERAVLGESAPTALDEVTVPAPPGATAGAAGAVAAVAAVRPYLLDAVVDRLDAGQMEWVADLRRVTVLFVEIGGIVYGTPATLDTLQGVAAAAQTVLHGHEGGIRQFLVDDKGTVLIAVFGLPPHAHEDDADRAVLAALTLRERLGGLGLHATAGITTGRAFCGPVGSPVRREYAVVGDVVNLAARLMGAAHASEGGVLCDEATQQAAVRTGRRAAGAALSFARLPPIAVKGKLAPVAVYAPGRRRTAPPPAAALLAGRSPDRPLVGRRAERAAIEGRLMALLRDGTGGAVVVAGEAGIGKSRFIEDLAARARELGAATLFGTADAIDRSTPYHAWRPVFDQLLGLDAQPDGAARAARVLARLRAVQAEAGGPDLLPLAPLLAPILSLDLPGNDLVAAMSDEARADNARDLLARLLWHAAGLEPRLVILEDAHWLDSASWALLRWVRQRPARLLLALAARPLAEPPPAEYRELLGAADTLRLSLDALSSDDAVALACLQLGVAALPEPAADLIRARSGGNPFFCEELAYALRDSGILLVHDGACRLADPAGDLSLAFPDTVQGVITSRIDRLSAAQQLTIKVASVVGRLFAFRTVRDVHPTDAAPRLRRDLEALRRLDLTPLETPEPDLAYAFKHIITQEVAYGLLLFAQRRRLHRAVAEWYERTYASDASGLAPYYPVLAHHWRQSVASVREEPHLAATAIDYLEKAAEQAVRSFANAEVVRFLGEAIALDDERRRVADATTRATRDAGARSDAPSRLRRARWERWLGDAHYRLGNTTPAREHLCRCLELLDQPTMATRGQATAALCRGLLRQAAHLALPRRPAGRAGEAERAALLEASRAYDTLAAVWYFAAQRLAFVAGVVHNLNNAETAGDSPELATALGLAGMVASISALPRLAERYLRRGLAASESIADPLAAGLVSIRYGLHHLGHGQWRRAEARVERARQHFEQAGDRRWREQALTVEGVMALYHGRHAEARARLEEVRASSRQRGDEQAVAWSVTALAVLGVRGTDEQAAAALRQLEELEGLLGEGYARAADPAIAVCCFGIRALGHIRRGERAAALSATDRALALLLKTSPVAYYSVTGAAYTTEALLELWETAPAAPERRQVGRRAQQAVRALQQAARVLPFALPQAALWRGTYEWLDGRPASARRRWRRALAGAERLRLEYERARLHFEIGRHLPPGEATRRDHLARAAALFAEIGCPHHQRRAQDAQHA